MGGGNSCLGFGDGPGVAFLGESHVAQEVVRMDDVADVRPDLVFQGLGIHKGLAPPTGTLYRARVVVGAVMEEAVLWRRFAVHAASAGQLGVVGTGDHAVDQAEQHEEAVGAACGISQGLTTL
jgi:hypothetical protein